MLYLIALFTAGCLYAYLGCKFLFPSGGFTLREVLNARARHGYLFGFILLIICAMGMVLLLTIYQLKLMFKNETTNEQSNRDRYDYLRDPRTGAYQNQHDRGCVDNLVSFCTMHTLPEECTGCNHC